MQWRQSRAVVWAAVFGLAAGSAFAAAPPARKPPAAAKLTLEQAIARVQQNTGGMVLSAEPRRLGRHTEYRIKVLTPEGHVQVIVVSSSPTGQPVTAPATQRAPRGSGNKEKH